MTDAMLLSRYQQDGSAQHLSELAGRHTQMVYGVCLRTLGNPQDAEDAAQAAFLVLLRKARTLRIETSVANWLFRVAKDTALNVRKARQRRAQHEQEAATMGSRSALDGNDRLWAEVRPQLDLAMAALPEREREATILRYYCGRTEQEVARELLCAQSTVSKMITRALERLGRTLSGQGVAVPAATLGLFLAERTQEQLVPAALASIQAVVAGKVAASAAAVGIAEGTMKAMLMAKLKLAAAVVGATLAVGGGGGAVAVKILAGEAAAPAASAPAKAERQGPLAALPSAPGAHLGKVKALGDNSWVNLGSPAPDPKWGKAPGRSWAARMPFAADLRGAFLFGEGPHGKILSNGHYMDDLWFYDLNAHRWVCVYPGIKAKGGYAEMGIKLNEDGFEATPDGHPLPIATSVHTYGMVTYDPDRKLFMAMPGAQLYCWQGIEGRLQYLEANKDKYYADGPMPRTNPGAKPVRDRGRKASPWMYNTVTGHWERYRTEATTAPGAAMGVLLYVPTVKKALAFQKGNQPFGWYDYEKRDWIAIARKGTLPPWDCDFSSCYDSRRDRIYLGGGVYPIIKKGQSALWAFDVKTETFSRLEPKGAPGSTCYSTNRAVMSYDSASDAVVLILYTQNEIEGEVPVPGIYVYHPDKNEWQTLAERPPELQPPRKFASCWNGFYDPELNAHFLYNNGDGEEGNGTMWAYRYRRAADRK